MNAKRSHKVLRSKSPGSINKMFHSRMKSNKSISIIKKPKQKKTLIKTPAKLNISKNSKLSNKRISKSRSAQSLPRIPGNDLKMIKEIFTKAKKYRLKYGQQKIPVKIMLSQNKSSLMHPRSTRSIPKYKNSSNTVNAPSYSISKLNFFLFPSIKHNKIYIKIRKFS